MWDRSYITRNKYDMEVSLFERTVWVKKYVHLRIESKTGHNVRLLSSTTSFAISYKLQERDCAFPKIP